MGYIGGLQEWQNFDLLIEIISLLIKNEKNIYFMIFSNDDISKYISMLDNKIGHDNYLYKSLYHDEVPSYLKLLDAGFLLRKNEILNIVSSPTKILEYLASGVPVICTKYSGDFERSIQHEKEGFILSSSDPTPTELKKLLLFIKKVKYERDKYRKICENAAGNRTWNEEFQNFFNRLVI